MRLLEAGFGVDRYGHEVRTNPAQAQIERAQRGFYDLLVGGALFLLESCVITQQTQRFSVSGCSHGDAVAEIQALVARAARSHCTVLAGAGLTVERVAEFVCATRVRAVHFGSGVRFGAQGVAAVDVEKVRVVRRALDC